MAEQNAIRFELVNSELIKRARRQLRHHNRHQRRKIAKLIELAGGQPIPVVTTADYEIIDGHALYDELTAKGVQQIHVAVLLSPSATDVRALRLLINRVQEDTRWDAANLKTEISELVEVAYDLDWTGFDTPEVDSLLAIDIPSGNVGEGAESVPPLQHNAVAQPGQIFQLGDHRLGCGDARDAAFVKAVCAGVDADCAFTDPPYNTIIDRVAAGHGKRRYREFVVASGEMSEADFFSFLRSTFHVLKQSCAPHAIVFVCIDWRHSLELLTAARLENLTHINTCVWAKTNAGLGSLYRGQHEFVHVFKAGDAPHRNNVELGRHGRHRSNLWSYPGMASFGKDRNALLAFHPTIKPVALVADALRDVTRRRDIVLDLFAGAGSTIAAAEESGRRCRAVELDPLFVDVAIRRWEGITGCDAICVDTGQTFKALATQRLLTAGHGDGW